MALGQNKLRLAGTVALLVAVAGCGVLQGRGLNLSGNSSVPTFEGERFRGSAKPVDSTHPERFVSTVSNVSQSFEGARAAAEYYGVKHCINLFGTSDIDWEIGPDTAPEALSIEGDKLSFSGTCVEI